MATSIAVQQEALTRAVSSQSLSNYAAIIRGFMAKGLAESEISPRENVFTYNAWKALGRQVKKGEHGVKCITVITTTDKRTGREERRPWTTTVFHVSQTEKISAIACNEKLAELDATDENVPYAGGEQGSGWRLADAASMRVDVRRTERINSLQIVDHDATPENVPFAGEDEASRESGLDDAIAALTPEPPKESASIRAMRGEQVSIMDMIAENEAKPKPARTASFSGRIQRIIDKQNNRQTSQSYQSKTVDF